MHLLSVVIGVLLTSKMVLSSHFRGGIIMWRPAGTQNPYEITITFRIAWRRSSHYCDGNSIISGNEISGEGTMECLSGCSSNIGPMSFICTDFSATEDWTTGQRTFNYIMPGEGPFVIGFDGCCWIPLLLGGDSWSLSSSINLTNRIDTGTPNSSPRSSLTPIVRIQYGCNHTISIPVTDADGDIIRCRWASSFQECGDVCRSFHGTLNQLSCTIDYFANENVGLYPVAIMIEDFAPSNLTLPLSRVGLQFLVKVESSSSSCLDKPQFVGDTPFTETCIGVPTNTEWSQTLTARAASNDLSIIEITTISPIGLRTSSIEQTGDADYSMNVTWTATDDLSGENIFCFSATDSAGSRSDQRCIKLVGGVSPPKIVDGSNLPTGEVLPDNDKWHLQFDKPIKRRLDRSVYIRFHNIDGEIFRIDSASSYVRFPQGSTGREIEITTSYRFTEKATYWITLDRGIVKGLEFCGPDLEPVTDPEFWRFTIRDITPPVLTWLNRPNISNGTGTTITWTFDEPSNDTCTLQTPNDIINAPCNKSFLLSGLDNGFYTLYVQGRDVAGNIASPVQTSFTIDKTAPVVTASVIYIETNQDTLSTTYSCSENQCTYKIKLYTTSTVYIDTTTSSGMFTWNGGNVVSDGDVYNLDITPRDMAENVGDTITVVFIADKQEPVIGGIAETVTLQCGDDLSPNNTVLGRPVVQDNLDIDPGVVYSDSPGVGCTFVRSWTAEDNAGNTAVAEQRIEIESTQPPTITFPDDTVVPCSVTEDLQDIGDEFRRTVVINHPCDRPVEVTFIDSINPDRCDITFTRTWTVADDCEQVVTESQTIRILPLQDPIRPKVGEVNVPLWGILEWPRYPGAIKYELYIWFYGDTRPEEPTITETNPDIRYYRPSVAFPQNTRILWQVVYTTGNEEIPSTIWGFTTKAFADLTVTVLEIPSFAYSGQSFDIKWTVENIGEASTGQNGWDDRIYMGKDTDFLSARYMDTVYQNRILDAKDGYQDEATIHLRDDDLDLHYVFVQSSFWNSALDINRDNNILRSTSPINIRLTPPPNLVVTRVVVPSSTFSGEQVEIRYTVTNRGTGPTKTNWQDRLYLSVDQDIDNGDTYLGYYTRRSILQVGESYDVIKSVYIDHRLYGEYWLLVSTDVYNSVYEHIGENDNIGTSNEVLDITLRPPPDLVPTALDLTQSWETGDQLAIEYTVTNEGIGTPVESWWRDRLELVYTPTGQRTIITTWRVHGINPTFTAGESYTNQIIYTVPPRLKSGSYRLIVRTDIYSQVFEFDKDTNNILEVPVSVTQTLADLVVTDVSVLTHSTEGGAFINVTYIIDNIGDGRTVESYWLDRVYVSSNNNDLFGYSGYTVYHHEHTANILPSGPITIVTNHLPIPADLYGTVDLYVKVDSNNYIFESNDRNNIYSVSTTLPKVQPDLSITHVEISQPESGVIEGGNEITLKWNVTNIGNRDISNPRWIDSVYLIHSETRKKYKLRDEIIDVGSRLLVNEYYTIISSIRIPIEFSGKYLARIISDRKQDVIDTTRENNIMDMEIEIRSPPSPDFIVTNIYIDYFDFDRILRLEWTVENLGNSMDMVQEWEDYVYLSNNKGEFGYKVASFKISASLSAAQQYHGTISTALPASLYGDYFVRIMCDASINVFELNGENNNDLWSERQISVSNPNERSVYVVINEIPDALITGEDFDISYSVTNNVNYAVDINSWTDGLYVAPTPNLSRQEILEEGLLIRNFPHFGGLAADDSYTMTNTASIPQGTIHSEVSAYLVVDINESVGFTSHGFVESLSPLQVDEGPLSDITYKDTIYTKLVVAGGAPFTFDIEIINGGNGTTPRSFYNVLYLSEDTLLDPFDIKLSVVSHDTKLNAGEFVTLTFNETIPLDLTSGPYYFISVLNSRGDVFESNKTNNERQYLIDLVGAASTDILVSSVSMSSDNWAYNSAVNFEWSIRNNGTVTAIGYKCDTAYLSVDENWNITDSQIGETQCQAVTIPPVDGNDTDAHDITHSLFSTIPIIAPSSYYGIIKSRSNIRDLNLENNVLSTNNTEYIGIQEIQLGITETIDELLVSGTAVFMIRSVPRDESLLIKLDTNTTKAVHELYVRANTPATKFNFDAFSELTLSANQEVIIPKTVRGDYYILVENSGNIRSSNIRLLAKIAVFEIRRATPNTLPLNGLVTMQIYGSLFGESIEAKLMNSVGKMATAENVYRFSSTEVYATFNCSQFTIGEYVNLELQDTDSQNTTVLSRVSQIIYGKPGEFKLSTVGPRRLRPGQVGRFELVYSNTGDADVIAPFLNVARYGTGILRMDDEGAPRLGSTHQVQGIPIDGPAGVLRPGSYGKIVVEAVPFDMDTGRMTLHSTKSEYQQLKDAESKENARPENVSPEVWDVVWANYQEIQDNRSTQKGDTFAKYLSISLVMPPRSSRSSSGTQGVSSKVLDRSSFFTDFSEYLLKLANGYLAGDQMLEVHDARDPKARGDLILGLTRRYSPIITKRRTKGAFGYGWICDLLDTKLTSLTSDTPSKIVLYRNREEIQFLRLYTRYEFQHGFNQYRAAGRRKRDVTINAPSRIRFQASTSEIIKQLGVTDIQYVLNGTDAITTFDGVTGNILRIVSHITDDELVYTYDATGNIVRKITHSQGYQISFTYNDLDLVEQLVFYHGDKLLSQMNYRYSRSSLTLVGVEEGIRSVSYTYNNDRDLVRVAYKNGNSLEYGYNSNGWLSTTKAINDNGVVAGSVSLSYPEIGVLAITHLPQNITTSMVFDQKFNKVSVKRNGLYKLLVTRLQGGRMLTANEQVVQKHYTERRSDSTITYVENGLSSKVSFEYKKSGELIRFTDPNGNSLRADHDSEGRPINITYPDGSKKQFRYNNERYPSEIMTQAGQLISYEYDEEGYLIRKLNDGLTNEYTYDSEGLMTYLQSAIGETTIEYADDKLPSKIRYPNGKQLMFTYNKNGQRTSISDNEGFEIMYQYDDKYKLTEVHAGVNALDLVLRIEYDTYGRISKKIAGNGIVSELRYDYFTGLLTNIENKDVNGVTVTKFVYVYDKRGFPVSVETREGLWKLTYDAASQLIGWEAPSGEITNIIYDSNGNRITMDKGGVEKGYITNEMNQYKEAGDASLMYDSNGNIIQKDTPNSSSSRLYDSEGRLIKVESPNERCEYTYDGMGNLYNKTCTTFNSSYLVDPFGVYGADIIMETRNYNPIYYIQTQELGLVAQLDGADIYYYQFDGRGSIASILSSSGELRNSYIYDPFGNILNAQEVLQNEFTFIGQWGVRRMAELDNTYNMRARQYDSEIGRFCSLDKLGLAGQSSNFYSYASNNPLVSNDPSGLRSIGLWGEIAKETIGAYSSQLSYGLNNCDKDESKAGQTIALAKDFIATIFPAARLGGILIGTAADLATQYFDGKQVTVSGAIQSLIGNTVSSFGGLFRRMFTGYAISKAQSVYGAITDENKSLWDALKSEVRCTDQCENDSVCKKCKDDPSCCIAGRCCQKPPCEACDNPPCKCKGKNCRDLDWVQSFDPNDIIGPEGYGDALFVSIQNPLDYRIRFENEENATAPAQKVFVTMDLDSDLDTRTFKITGFGFGEFVHEIEYPQAIYQGMVNFTEIGNMLVRVRAGVDVVSDKVIWDFQTIDPMTGEPPTDPGIGFLPPNNGTSGQGYVTYSVSVKKNTPSMTRIDATADIIFDKNEPIETPPIFNTVDVDSPIVNVTVLTNVTTNPIVSLSKGDIGAGVRDVDIYSLLDNGTYVLIVGGINESYASLPLEMGAAYTLKAIGVDYVGNRASLEETKSIPVEFPEFSGVECSGCSGHGNCSNGGVCVCDEGYYGPDCASTTVFLEPPILEASLSPSSDRATFALYLNARLVSMDTIPDDITIMVTGFPTGVIINDGDPLTESDVLSLTEIEFGEYNITTPEMYSGNASLLITAAASVGDVTTVRNGSVNMDVKPKVGVATLAIQESCVPRDGVPMEVKFQVGLDVGDISKDVAVYVYDLPEDWSLLTQDGYAVEQQPSTVYQLNSDAITRGSFILEQTGDNVGFTLEMSAQTMESVNASIDMPLCPAFACPSEDDVYADPDDCTTYYTCTEGQEVLLNCPDGKHFSVENKICMEPNVADCEPETPEGNLGDSFMLIFGENPPNNGDIYVVISTPFATDVTVSVDIVNTPKVDYEIMVRKGSDYTITLPSTLRVTSSGVSNKAVHVSSTHGIAVTTLNEGSCGGYLAIPIEDLGIEYYALTWSSDVSKTQVGVTATADGTLISLTLPAGVTLTFDGIEYTGGDTIEVVINQNELAYLQSEQDLSGTYISANKPVMVISGSTDTTIGTGTALDQTESQMIPTNVWGRGHVIPAIPYSARPYYFKVVAIVDSTTVNPSCLPQATILGSGDVKVFMPQYNENCYVTSSQPIQIVQYVQSSDQNDAIWSAPASILIPPIGQYMDDYFFNIPPQEPRTFVNYLLMVVPKGKQAGIYIDSVPVTNAVWEEISDSDMVEGFVTVQPGAHRLKHSDPNVKLGAFLYGSAVDNCAFGYPAGVAMAEVLDDITSPPTGPTDCQCTTLIVESRQYQPEYSGLYHRMSTTLNLKPVYRHEQCERYLYFVQHDMISYWIFSTVLGSNAGHILVTGDLELPDDSRVAMTWRSFDKASTTWNDDSTVKVTCVCGQTSPTMEPTTGFNTTHCSKLTITGPTPRRSVQGYFTLASYTLNGRTVYENPDFKLFLYHYVDTSCAMWVVGPVLNAKSGAMHTSDVSFYPHQIRAQWAILLGGEWDNENNIMLNCV